MQIPGYSIQRIIGHGGMATVYLAVQESLGREVALKVLLPALALDPVAPERFLREARFAAQLHHPHIVAIHEVGTHEGTPFMAMGYEPGGTLAGTPPGGIDPRVALRAVRDIASALDYAHKQGVVHRDVKPENILRRKDGSCVLSDFGIAHALATQSGLTNEGTSVGTPHYMSPEQLRGDKVDGRGDLYSLGIVLYQLLTGALPYQGTDGWAIGMQHLSAPIPKLPTPLAWLQPLIDALLAKEPAHRIQTGSDLVSRIDALLSAPRPGQIPPMGATTGQVMTRPERRVHWMIAAPIALIVVASLMFMQTTNRKRDQAARATAQTAAALQAAADAPAASIAVLPFVDMSQGQDQAYFSDGLAEELINVLAQDARLRVAGRTSSFHYRGSDVDVRRVGRELGVRSLLEGSVRRDGDRVRVTVQLINASDGFPIWSQTYDNRALAGIYALQDEIAASVAQALKIKLLEGAQAKPAEQHRATTAEAYTQYLAAQQTRSRGTAESARARVDAFRKVIELDPKFAPAYAQVATAESWAADYADDAAGVAAAQRQAMADADRAIKLDPELADGYLARGNLRANLSWDWQGAREDFEKAFSLSPGDARILQGYGSLLASLGQLPEAIATTRKAAERDPMQFSLWQALGYYQEAAGHLAEARVAQQRALALRADFPFVQYRLGMIELQQRQPRRALAIFNAIEFEPVRLLGQAMSQHDMRHASESQVALDALMKGYGYNAAYQIAQAYAWRDQPDMAFEWLDRAFVQRDGGLAEVKYDTALRGLRSDPRFAVLLRKLGLPV